MNDNLGYEDFLANNRNTQLMINIITFFAALMHSDHTSHPLSWKQQCLVQGVPKTGYIYPLKSSASAACSNLNA